MSLMASLQFQLAWQKRALEFSNFAGETRDRGSDCFELLKSIGRTCYHLPGFTNIQNIYLDGLGYIDTDIEKEGICWEAPGGIVIRINEIDALGFGFALKGAGLFVLQMQGAEGIKFHRKWYMWPKLMLKGAMAFAENSNIAEVRVRRANCLSFYEYPVFKSRLSAKEYKTAVANLRARLRQRYDELPLQLGFQMEDDWMVWKNPQYKERP